MQKKCTYTRHSENEECLPWYGYGCGYLHVKEAVQTTTYMFIKNGYNTKILFVGTLFVFFSSTNQYSINNLNNEMIF